MPSAKELSLDEVGEQTLESFESLFAALDSNDLFKHYQVESPENGIVSITEGDVTNIFLAPEVWQDPAKSAPFRSSQLRVELYITCVGTRQDLHLNRDAVADLQTLELPLRISSLQLFLYNHFQLQNRLYHTEVNRRDVEDTNESVKYVLRVSRELNGVRDTNRLLSIILMKAREIVNADAGSIYVVNWDDENHSTGFIKFKVTQNETVTLNLSEFEIAINEGSIVGNAAIHETSINIPDLYALDPDSKKNPYNAQHDRQWDDRIGYQCRSMLTVPMFDISNRVIGVIQLINRRKKNIPDLREVDDFSGSVLPFDENSVEYAEIIAHQAGIALENALLTEEREQLFDGFVHASVTAIEQRDPTTSGHSHRVAKLTLEMAKLLNRIDEGPYRATIFDEDQLKEIEYASLLHDFGKLGVREEVLVKAKKLYPLEMSLVLERFDHLRSRYELEYSHEMIEYLENPTQFPPGFGAGVLKANLDRKLDQLDDYLAFIKKCNEPTVLEQGGFERLKDIANITFNSSFQKNRVLLGDGELRALSVSRGSLTREEFAEIQSHVTHTFEFLRKIPWGKFANVPQIAAKHHEKLDGSGYPTGAFGEEIPVQSRIMTIADIFDALTASDRPYKKAVPTPKALDIIDMEVRANKIDKELFDIFLESKIYQCVLDPNDPHSF